MRSLTKKLAHRLSAQAREAEIQGLTKVATHLDCAIEKNSIRENDANYTYAEEDFKDNVERNIWLSAVRAMDFYDCHIDAADMQPVIEKLAWILTEEVRIKGGVRHGVGAHEPNVPGERLEKVTIELSEENE
jgi:hypothetical protein